MSEGDPSRSILEPGRNCAQLARAQRVAFLVDGAAYFAAFRAAALRARHSILILAWDIDSRIRLAPDGAPDGMPESLGDFLDVLVKERGIEIWVLDWDFAMLYAADRELLPVFKLGWRTPRRLHFHLDAAHPIGASHHQKVVVVDDAIAFAGGLDLTHGRWDTPEHRPDHPHRRLPGGGAYRPFHDVQVAVDGEAAAALGELARERWRRATGKTIPAPAASGNDPWPADLAANLTDVDVAISRTEPSYRNRPEVQEIKHLYLDAIAAARRHLYIENQYFCAGAIGDALATRLEEDDGPEVIVLSRKGDSDWLEESTIGVMRARLHRQLRDADHRRRYRSFYPHVPGHGDRFVNVHSKLMFVDDELLTIGSANLNNRSLGLDTECNLTIEARGERRIRRAIAGLRRRLLAEHLGNSEETVAAAEEATGSPLAALAELRGGDRTLEPLEPTVSSELDDLIPAGTYLDPERPVQPERLLADFLPEEQHTPAKRRLLGLAAVLVTLLGLAAAWRFTPLGDWLDLDRLVGAAEVIRELPATPLLVLGIYVLAGLFVVPVTLLIAVTALVFEPLIALAYSLTGTTLSAVATYGLGRAVGRQAVRRVAGSRINRLSQQLGKRGLVAVILARLVPVSPFSVVNLVAGASHIRFRDLVLGTLLGIFPGAIATVLFIDRVVAAVRDPSAGTFAVLAGIVLVVVAGALALRRWLGKRREAPLESGFTR